MIQLDRDGYIRGGMAYGRMKQRSGRALGSRHAWDEIAEDKKYVKVNNGWYQIKKTPNHLYRLGSYGSGDAEIGYLRMHQDVFPQLVKNKVKFRLKHMNSWIEGIASCEFGVGTTDGSPINEGNALDPEKMSNTFFGLCPPSGSDDFLYNREHPNVPKGIVKR